MDQLTKDIRFGARMLVNSPVVTSVAIVALTLGIGATTALFSVVNSVLLRRFRCAASSQLEVMWENGQRGVTDENVINLVNFSDRKERNHLIIDMAVVFVRALDLTSLI